MKLGLEAAAALLIVSTTAGCLDSNNVTSPRFSTVSSGVSNSAQGGGKISVSSPPPAVGVAEFAFTAHVTTDGRTMGRFHMKRQRAGFNVEFRGEVTCLAVDELTNRAWIGGIVTDNLSDDPFHTTAIHEPGQDVWFRVVDNGEAANSPPDRASVYGFKGAANVQTSAEYCQLRLWPAGDVNTFEVTKGNIQVRAR